MNSTALPRLVGMYFLWLLAAGSVAVTVAVVVTELMVVVGLIDRSGGGYGLSLSIVTGACFVVLAVIPFLFRDRFRMDDHRETEPT
ncbi:MAG: hypothetical protein M5U23_12110 [Acidimicrobiia bacterium]|nr:hypothetical protein [Acidimicrobiia bacterium]